MKKNFIFWPKTADFEIFILFFAKNAKFLKIFDFKTANFDRFFEKNSVFNWKFKFFEIEFGNLKFFSSTFDKFWENFNFFRAKITNFCAKFNIFQSEKFISLVNFWAKNSIFDNFRDEKLTFLRQKFGNFGEFLTI